MSAIRWDRETVKPAEFIFPAVTVKERDINGHVLREECAKHPHFGKHFIELRHNGQTVADACKISGGWSVAISSREWPHNHIDYKRGLCKADVYKLLREMAA